MASDFLALDVKTTNADLASISVLELAHFRSGAIHRALTIPVDARRGRERLQDHDGLGVSRPRTTIGAVLRAIKPQLDNVVVAHHGPLDRAAIRKASLQTGLPEPDCAWIDTMQVAQRAWPDLAADGGYALGNCARALRLVAPSSHLAGQARCAGQVLLRAMAQTGLTLQQWIDELATTDPFERMAVDETEGGGSRRFATIEAGTPQWTQWFAWFEATSDERARLFSVLDRLMVPSEWPPAVQSGAPAAVRVSRQARS